MMRTLQLDSNNGTFKVSETADTIDLAPMNSSQNYVFKSDDTAVIKVGDRQHWVLTAPATILSNNHVQLKTSDLAKIQTSGTYRLELWVQHGNGTTDIFPDQDFATITLNQNVEGDDKWKEITLTDYQTAFEHLAEEMKKTAVKGDQGPSGTITVADTKTADSNTPAQVTNTGDKSNAVLHFVIPKGKDGTNGDPGKDGESAYQLAVDDGFKGQLDDWLKSLKGQKGDTGTPPVLEPGTVTTGDAGSKATLTWQKVNDNTFKLNATIPQGVKGDPGPTGKNFEIKKTFASVAEMNNSKGTGLDDGDFVLISSNDQDNGKLYVFDGKQFNYLSKLTGPQGIKGDTGPAPVLKIGTVTRLDANASPTFTLTEDIPGSYTVNVGIPAGKSAYQIAVEKGFKGTEAEWLNQPQQAPTSMSVQIAGNDPNYTSKVVFLFDNGCKITWETTGATKTYSWQADDGSIALTALTDAAGYNNTFGRTSLNHDQLSDLVFSYLVGMLTINRMIASKPTLHLLENWLGCKVSNPYQDVSKYDWSKCKLTTDDPDDAEQAFMKAWYAVGLFTDDQVQLLGAKLKTN